MRAACEVAQNANTLGPAPQIAALIRDRVLAECSLHASFGVATCKTVAKVASELRKPRGFVVVAAGGGKLGSKSSDTYIAFSLP